MKRKIISKKTNGSYTYYLTGTGYISEEYGKVTVYGIGIYGEGYSEHIDDISPELDRITEFFELIGQEQLYPEHLYDAAEDFISSF